MAPTQPAVDTAGYATILSANQTDFDAARNKFATSKSLIDISISTSPRKEVLYTAVWAPDLSRIDTIVTGNVTAGKFQEWVQTCYSQGRKITAISATGNGVDARFAGLALKKSGTQSAVTTVLVDLNEEGQQRWQSVLYASMGQMRMIKSYGTADNPRYANLFRFSPDTPFAYWTTGSAADMDKYNTAYKAMKTWSPYWVTVNGTQRSVFYSPRAVGNWEIQANLDQASFSKYLQKLPTRDLHPICVQQVDARTAML